MTTSNPVLAGAGGTGPASAPLPRRRKHFQGTPYLLILPAVAAMLVGMGYPLYWLITNSLREYGMAQQFGQPAPFIGLENYKEVFTDPVMWHVVGRSIAFCLVTALATVVLGVLIAQLMRAVAGGVRIAIQVALMLAWATPMVAYMTVWRWLFERTQGGVVNWILVNVFGLDQFAGHNWFGEPLSFFAIGSLIITWASVPFVATSVYAALTQVSQEIIEASQLDGANNWQRFWQIIVPTIRPVLSIVLLLQIIWDLRVFGQIQLL